MEIFFFEQKDQLIKWFENNYDKESEMWIKIYKKYSCIKSVSYDDVLEICLCFGWIDGLVKKYDDNSFIRRLTPRRKNSNWSKRNIVIFEELVKRNQVREHGIKVFNEFRKTLL